MTSEASPNIGADDDEGRTAEHLEFIAMGAIVVAFMVAFVFIPDRHYVAKAAVALLAISAVMLWWTAQHLISSAGTRLELTLTREGLLVLTEHGEPFVTIPLSQGDANHVRELIRRPDVVGTQPLSTRLGTSWWYETSSLVLYRLERGSHL